ncbi:T9SS type A sorting domain-containing protein [Aequorivita sp. SDUM287046]|uniref:T9SS type A sorting domain-containing protein n=1 Tax=Aequorivita aurantiaca TaxID=3053356 RepID=A0ABT8DF41_9FLAO|nr:T9SS type A sorting domain-containing protein [Aequorivita aurantiaca]MDN3723249.1 T9SS type A sorting domain-containing protein [Aequorivita aurantiaca]
MKNVITLLMCSLCIFTGISQSDLSQKTLIIPEKTPELEALYQQAEYLNGNGTAAEINANIAATKAAWQLIDPNIAALYKPLIGSDPIFGPSGEAAEPSTNSVSRTEPQPVSRPEWNTDILIHEGYVDGLDMDVAFSGDLYIGMFESLPGASSHTVSIYKSTDNGISWSLFGHEEVSAGPAIKKIQMISIDDSGSGEDFILIYILFDNGQFTALRWNMSNGNYSFDTIVSGVEDFSVDTNYSGSASQRVFATYIKTDNSVYSARSTAGSYGFNWADEVSLGILGEQLAFTYGLNGSCYTTFLGYNSKNLRANVNDSYNDPASWGTNLTITDSAVTEILNPTIRATRNEIVDDKVLIFASSRDAGSTDAYKGIAYLRENEGTFTVFSEVEPEPGYSVSHTDSWIRKGSTNSEIIQTSYVLKHVSNTLNNQNRLMTFNGTNFQPSETVADELIHVFDGFPSAVAETIDASPCMAFAGSSGGFGYNLYFDSANFVLGTENNTINDFKLYPNPSKEVLNLSAQNYIEHVSIYSVLGQKVLEISPQQNEATINVASFNPGVYILKLTINGKSATHKFVKK